MRDREWVDEETFVDEKTSPFIEAMDQLSAGLDRTVAFPWAAAIERPDDDAELKKARGLIVDLANALEEGEFDTRVTDVTVSPVPAALRGPPDGRTAIDRRRTSSRSDTLKRPR